MITAKTDILKSFGVCVCVCVCVLCVWGGKRAEAPGRANYNIILIFELYPTRARRGEDLTNALPSRQTTNHLSPSPPLLLG